MQFVYQQPGSQASATAVFLQDAENVFQLATNPLSDLENTMGSVWDSGSYLSFFYPKNQWPDKRHSELPKSTLFGNIQRAKYSYPGIAVYTT
jgi:hypothetical protein